ncbi:MAG: hypothetical protein HFH74_07135 [Lachnospiraceae bacterium]|nr:hypothetical protein [Lachnospiraceae bacterium]
MLQLAEGILIVYHGTEKERGKKILAEQRMIPSISDDRRQHWLGDGIYLYREMFYAFRWIELMYKKHFSDMEMREDLLEKYSILYVAVAYNPERIFNLDNPEHYMVFRKTEQAYREKSIYSPKIQKCEYSDGVIINILFKNLKYGENYDAVEAVFPTVELDEKLTEKSRLKSINEYQLCIKNDEIIGKIEDVSDRVDFDTYHSRLINFRNFKKQWGTNRDNTIKYKNGQKGGKYGKW